MAKKISEPKELDITKTGPVGFKQLQLTNASNYESLDLDTYDFLKGIKSLNDSFTLYDPVRLSEHYIMSPLGNQKTAWGESMFDDKTATAELFKNLLDIRADNQPGILLLANGAVKGAVLAGTTFLLGTVGLATGLANWASTGEFNKFWDNPFNNAMQLVTEWSEENIPNYYAEGQQEKPFWELLGTANFWGDQFLKNTGFTIGAYYSGAAFTKLLSPILKMSQMAGGAKVLGALNDVKLGKMSVAEASLIAGKVAQTPAIINTAVGSFTSAVNEGAIEALNNSKDYKQLEYAKAADDYNNKMSLLQAQYGNSEMYKQLEDALNKEHLDNLAKIDAKALVMGNTDLLLNIPILTLSNAILFGKLYSGGFKTNRKIQNLINRKSASLQLAEAGKVTEDIVQLESKGLTKAQKLLKATNAVRKTSLTEGLEEMNQYAASTTAGNFADKYYLDKNDPEATNMVDNLIVSSALGLAEAYSSLQAWNEFFVGALTGALGMPTFGAKANSSSSTYLGRGKAVGLSGGIIGQTRANNEAAKDLQEVIDYVNNRVKSPGIFKDYRENLIAHTKALNEMDNAAYLGKEMEFLDASFRQLAADVEMFSRVGKTLDLIDMINAAYDTSDANIQAIIENTKALVTDGVKSPFMDDKGNALPKDKIIDKLTKAKDDILNTVDNYTKTLELLDVMYGEALTDKLLQHATWMTMLKDNWKAREDLMASEVIDYFKPIISNIDSQLNYLNTNADRLDTLGVKRTEEQDNLYIKTLDEIKTLDNFKDVINSISTAKDNMGLNLQVPSVSKDGKIISLADVINSWFEVGSEISKELFNNNIGTVITTTKEEVALKLKDIVTLSNKRNSVDKTIKEYINHPEKFDESGQRVTNQTVENQANNNRNASKETLAKATTQKELRSLLLTDYDSLDENNKSIIDELIKEGNKAAQAYKTVSKKKKNVSDKLNSLNDINSDDVEAALNLMDRSAQGASDFKEFLDPTNLAMDIDESEIEDYIDKMDNGLVPSLETRELIEKAITDRNQRAKELLMAALDNSDLIESQLDILEKQMGAGIDSNTDLLDAAINEAIDKETATRLLLLSDLELGEIAAKVADKMTKEGLSEATNSSNLIIKKGDIILTPDIIGTISKIIPNGLAIVISDDENSLPQVVSLNDITSIFDKAGANITSSRQAKPITKKDVDSPETTGNSGVTPTAVVNPTATTNINPEEGDSIEEWRIRLKDDIGESTSVNNSIINFDDNIKLDDSISSSQLSTPYEYWKSAIAEVPIGSNLSVEQRTMHVLEYLKSKELPQEVIDKYSEQYNLLIQAGAFDYIDSGNLKIGQRVYFKYHKSTNTALGGFIGMYVNNSNNKKQLIGFLPHPTDAAFSKYANLLSLYDTINKDGEFSNTTSKVNQILIGKVPYTNLERTLKEIFNTPELLSNVKLGIVKNGRIETGGIIHSDNILQPMNPKEGLVYVLTPNSNINLGKDGYSPSAVIFEYDNSNEEDALVQRVRSLIWYLINPESGRDFIDTILTLDEIFYMQDTHFNLYGHDGKELRTQTSIDVALRNGEKITFNIKDSNGFLFKAADRPLIGNPEDAVGEFIESYLAKKPLNIRLSFLNLSSYNELLLGHLHNNMTNSPHTVGDFFTINPLDENGLEKKAGKILTTGVNPIRATTTSLSTSETTIINYAGVDITVNIKSGTGFYTDKSGKTIYIKKGDRYYDSAVAKYLIESNKVHLDVNGLYPVGDLGTGYWDDNIGIFVDKGVKNKFSELIELAKKAVDKYLRANKQESINIILDDVADLLQMSETKPVKEKFKDVESYEGALNRYYYKVNSKLDELMDIADMNADVTIKNKTALSSNIPIDELTYYSELIDKLKLDEENALDAALLEAIEPLKETSIKEPESTKKTINIPEDEIEDSLEDLASFINDSNKNDLDTEAWRRVDGTSYTLAESTKSLEDEITWLQKVLPLLSNEEHLLLIDGLLRTKDDNKAWGMFKLGVIVLSKSSAPGTLYHESMHAVLLNILSQGLYDNYLTEAMTKYNTTNPILAEELLAEDFRKYMLIELTPIVGKLLRLFRTLKNFIDGFRGNEFLIDKLFYDINHGKYAQKQLSTKNPDSISNYSINDIRNYQEHKLDFDKLNLAQLNFLKENNIGEGLYNKLTNEVKDRMFYCGM